MAADKNNKNNSLFNISELYSSECSSEIYKVYLLLRIFFTCWNNNSKINNWNSISNIRVIKDLMSI